MKLTPILLLLACLLVAACGKLDGLEKEVATLEESLEQDQKTLVSLEQRIVSMGGIDSLQRFDVKTRDAEARVKALEINNAIRTKKWGEIEREFKKWGPAAEAFKNKQVNQPASTRD